MVMKFEKLPLTKSKNGYNYSQVARSKKAAVYSMTNEKFPEDTSVGYEVFTISVCQPYSLIQKKGPSAGKVYDYPAAEKFPGNEAKNVWTFTTKQSAMKKFNEVK